MNNGAEKLKELINNEETRKELFSIEKVEDAQKYLAEHGVDMTVEEVACFGAMLKKLAEGEITPEQIEAISNLKEEDLKLFGEDVELSNEDLAKVSGGSIVASVLVSAAALVGYVAAASAVIAAGYCLAGGLIRFLDWAAGRESDPFNWEW